ncbi:MAG TPA: HAD-IIA family hydrolase [Jatrophihabitantaceae bacterium]
MPPSLQSSSAQPLVRRYDVALLDLDGVVYVGADAVPGVPEALAKTRAAGMRLAFVTNNAARPPAAVAAHLSELGIPAAAAEVITSAQAAAHYLAERLPASSPVLVVGTTGLVEALRERGLRPVFSADDEPAAVVQGYSPGLDWRQLAEGAVAIRRGVPWVATNLDPTVPSPRGPLPGNGSLVAALRHATGALPVSTGKPDPAMHRESVERSGAERPIVVGDRLDTDIEGATAVGCASLLVLSGVTKPDDLLMAPPDLRPDFIARDVTGLLQVHAPPQWSDGRACYGQWQASAAADELHLDARPSPAGAADRPVDDDLDALRALCAAAWRALDTRHADEPGASPAGRPGDATRRGQHWRFRADGHAAEMLRSLGLS